MDNRYFSDKVVEWYKVNKRELPWRYTKDPYKVWLSEIILQQTRVNQGMPYYLKFVERFPTVHALASASEQDVLRMWQGLGYYTRARNLHKCAKVVVSTYNGEFPTTFEGLLRLPGIGEYTAAAIASFSFSEPVAVVDGNVFRVLSRVFGVDTEINSPIGRKIFTDLANTLISKRAPDFHNQAIMEFGALQCIPKNPPCITCSLKPNCFAALNNVQSEFPRKTKSKAARKRYFYYIVIQRGQSVLMRKRSDKDIWHGLYDFNLIEKTKPRRPDHILKEFADEFKDELVLTDVDISGEYKHILTHQVIVATFIVIKTRKFSRSKDSNLKFYTFEKINDLPKPVLITRFLSDYKNFHS